MVKSKKMRCLSFVVGILSCQAASAKPLRFELSWPEEANSQETLERTITAILRVDRQLIMTSLRLPFLIVGPFGGLSNSRKETFGEFLASERKPWPTSIAPGSWRGLAMREKHVLALDGEDMNVLAFSASSYEFTSRHSLAWDVIKPPRDRGGEPTTVETTRLRRAFAKQLQKTLPIKFVGMAQVPKDWGLGADAYLLATRVKGYPVVAMECRGSLPSQCVVIRACFPEGIDGIDSDSISGIGISAARRQVLIGEPSTRSIHVLKFDTCFNLPKTAQIALPEKMKDLSALHVDSDDNLWLGTQTRDDYYNASLYVWGAKQWKSKRVSAKN